jgi:excisionase family DNA binding protein
MLLSSAGFIQRREKVTQRLLGLTEAARTLSVSIHTLRRLVACGDIATVNVGARRLVRESEVDRIVQRGVGQARQPKVNRKAS